MSGVAVVGGGMAGLAAAQRLARGHGVPVTLFDQGQRSGGRASSRDFAELSFDHGAQV